MLKEVFKSPSGIVYQGDCYDFLSDRIPGDNEYIITDPPWGHGKDVVSSPGGRWVHLKPAYEPVKWNKKPDQKYFDKIKRYRFLVLGMPYLAHFFPGSGLKESKEKISDSYVKAILDSNPKGFIVWDKKKPDGVSFCGYEIAYSNMEIESEVINWLHNGLAKQEPVAWRREEIFHPCQKPVGLWMAILKKCLPGGEGTIIEPFAGSCSLAVACERMNAAGASFQWVCIEKHETYCQHAVEWLRDEQKARRLF